MVRTLSRSLATVVFIAIAASAIADSDDLSAARRSLRPAPCGESPAVTAVATVNGNSHEVYIGDFVVISVCHLDVLLKEADGEQAPINLFVEGIDTGNEAIGIDAQAGTLTFILDRNDKNRELWRPFLYAPLFDPVVAMHLSIGIRGERPLPRAPGSNLTVQLRKIYVDWTTWIWFAVLIAIAIVLLFSAAYTDMLRDGPPVDSVRQPYSLARTQMAWWFFFIVVSYSYIWLVTGDRDTIPPSLLGLMGISSATALAAVLIAPSSTARTSRGFARDLVTDDRGVVALDRLQIVVWTVVLGGIFLYSVIWELTMPEFNGTLLALMGISSGTYIGFKIPEKKT